MSTLFASDIHLSTTRPERIKAFKNFLLGPCRRADALYLLGDVFDVWLGDDDSREPHPEILSALTDLTAGGVPVHFMTGNHDLLIGDGFMRASGCRAIHEPHCIELHGRRVVLLHGDALCTRDEGYQAWRRTFTDPRNQQKFLALRFAERVARAAQMQLESSTQTALKTEDIMDVTLEAVISVLNEHKATHMIHGHTHRPAVHSLLLDDKPATRVVLGDWYGEEIVLAWDANGLRLDNVANLGLA